MKVSCSLVLYNTNKEDLKKVIDSLLNDDTVNKIYVVDNSPQKNIFFEEKDLDQRISYIHTPSNPGFGSSHNLAISKAITSCFDYHFIVNPDVYFEGAVISKMVNYIDKDDSIGMMMPQILNDDGTIQNLPKLLPSLYSILIRKIKKPKNIYRSFIAKYEFRNSKQNEIYNVPILSGCFTLVRLDAIKKVGMYDDRFFMYFEDWDLSRRMHKHYKTLYFPKVTIYHGYESGANKSFKLFRIYIKSLITYFNKWGWFFDKDRNRFNKEALKQL